MKMKRNTKFVVTGISRLTGDRVVISKPMEKEMAVQLRKKKIFV